MNINISGILDDLDEALGVRKKRVLKSSEEIRDMMQYHRERSGIVLNDEHERIMSLIFQDKANVFVTGGAGVGKTTFMGSVVIHELERLGLYTAVTATTGIAGSHLKGKTIHSWAGIGLGPVFFSFGPSAVDMTEEELREVYRRTYEKWCNEPGRGKAKAGIKERMKSVEVLIIDEVSMCPGEALLGYLDFFMKINRGNEEPFGGVQMIFVGDMAQLPPVSKNEGSRPDWAFMSRSWKNANVKTAELTHVFRQEDKEFASFLNNRRIGIPMTPEEEMYAKRFVKQQSVDDVKRASFLVATNAQADRLNAKALEWYPEPEWVVPATFKVNENMLRPWETVESVKSQLIGGKLIKETLRLRIGMPVLLTINDPEGRFVNGTKAFVEEVRGVGEDVQDEKDSVVPKPKSEPTLVLRLASNENTLIEVQKKEFYRSDQEAGQNDVAQDMHVPDEFKTHYVAQFPIIPATAVTIHKSQGASLDECTVDLSRTFAPGHVYVALSRLRTADGLTLLTDRFSVDVDPHVMRFYQNLRKERNEHTGV